MLPHAAVWFLSLSLSLSVLGYDVREISLFSALRKTPVMIVIHRGLEKLFL